jgi:putative membrane protein insertion efficiency factor
MSDRTSFFHRVAALPAQAMVALIRGYQATVSPALPALFGSTAGCRFAPTCSHYAVEALRTRGLVVGLGLSVWRLVRCNPLHPGGNDPVPSKRSTPRCTRVIA